MATSPTRASVLSRGAGVPDQFIAAVPSAAGLRRSVSIILGSSHNAFAPRVHSMAGHHSQNAWYRTGLWRMGKGRLALRHLSTQVDITLTWSSRRQVFAGFLVLS